MDFRRKTTVATNFSSQHFVAKKLVAKIFLQRISSQLLRQFKISSQHWRKVNRQLCDEIRHKVLRRISSQRFKTNFVANFCDTFCHKVLRRISSQKFRTNFVANFCDEFCRKGLLIFYFIFILFIY